MGHAELLADLAEIAQSITLVMHDRGAANHLEIRNPRQMTQDFVLDAVSEVGVLLVVAQVLKGQDRYAFLQHRQGGFALFITGRWRAANELNRQKSGSDYRNDYSERDNLAPLMMRDRLAGIDFRFTLDSFRRTLKRPGSDHRRREPEHENDDK